MEKKDVFSVVRYLDIKNMSIPEMEHLIACFDAKAKRMDEEICLRKRSGQIIVPPPSPNDSIESRDVCAVINSLNIKTLSISQLTHLMDLFTIKSKQMREEIAHRL